MNSLARYAWFVLLFNVLTILVGALVRATGSGAGCGASWPTCQGSVVPDLEGATAIEFTHRAISGIALVLVVVLAVLVWRGYGRGEAPRLGATLAVIAIVGEALIGAVIVLAEWVAEDTSVARAISVPVHLVNTLFLLAALTLTAFWLSGGRRLDFKMNPRMTKVVILGAVAIALIAGSGAVTALADTLFPGEGVEADFSVGAHFLTRLRVIHPILAVSAAAMGYWVAGRQSGPRSRTAQSLLVLVGLMIVTGSLNVLLGVPTWMQVVHLALADALWITFVLVSAQSLEQMEPARATH